MQYYKGDFPAESFSERHPAVTRLIWWSCGLIIMTVSAYLGGVEYIIQDILKNM